MEKPRRLLSLACGVLAAGCLAAGAVPAPAFAQSAAPAASTTASTTTPAETRSTHGDWIVRCKTGGAHPECEAVQTLQTPDLKGIVAHIAVRAEKDGPVRLIVLVPPGVWLPANVIFKVPGVPDITLTYKRCGQHCVASVDLGAQQIAALKASAGAGEFTFENGSRSPILLPVSFKGLGAAMEASLKH